LILRDSAAQLWVSERESCDGGARVGRAGVDGGEGARACKENDVAAYLAVALAPAAVVGLDGRAAAHVFSPPGCCDGQRAVARSRFFAACRLSAGCQPPATRLGWSCGALVGGARKSSYKGQPRLGGQNTQAVSH